MIHVVEVKYFVVLPMQRLNMPLGNTMCSIEPSWIGRSRHERFGYKIPTKPQIRGFGLSTQPRFQYSAQYYHTGFREKGSTATT